MAWSTSVTLFALTADQVHMLSVLGQVIGRRSVVDVAVLDEAELLEQLQGPVNGGDIDATRGLPYLAIDVFRRSVLQPADCLKDELALRRDTVAASPERVVPRRHHTHKSNDARSGEARTITRLPEVAGVT